MPQSVHLDLETNIASMLLNGYKNLSHCNNNLAWKTMTEKKRLKHA